MQTTGAGSFLRRKDKEMGINNSSDIRVRPLGECLVKYHEKVNDLLQLISCADIDFGPFRNEDIFFAGSDLSIDIDKAFREKGLIPPENQP